jgi:predicted ATP-grasp superfamily ATP-dependent carboligase
MLAAATADFAVIPDVKVTALLDDRLCDRLLDPRVELIRVDAGSEPLAFRDAAAHADFTLVIAPEIDGILHQRCIWAAGAGAKLLGPSPDAVALTSDKLALARHWLAAGVPTPSTLPRANDSPPFPPPWIVKPRRGAGSVGIRIVRPHPHSPASGGVGVRGVEDDAIIQPLIPGEAASVAYLIGPNQTIALPPCWQHFDAQFHYLGGSTPIPHDFSIRATAIARRAIDAVPGLRGYVGVDIVLGEADMAIEINPRLTTSYIGLRQLAESNLAEALLRIVRGEPAELRWRDASIHFSATS